jgi:hypothetical protein
MRIPPCSQTACVHHQVAHDSHAGFDHARWIHESLALMAAPAEKMEIPSDSVAYARADLEETIKIFLKHGVRFLSPEEIADEMPAFPSPSAA